MLLILALVSTVTPTYARSAGHSSGHSSCHSSSHSSSHGSSHNSFRSSARTSRAGSSSSFHSSSGRSSSRSSFHSTPAPSARASRVAELPSMRNYSGASSLSGFSSRVGYLNRPYNSSSFYNYYFPYAFLSAARSDNYKKVNITKGESEQLKASDSHFIKIKNESRKEIAVLVNKNQFDQIKVGDKLELKDKKIFLNDKELLK